MPGGGRGETTFPPFDPVNFTPMLIWLSLSFGLLYILMSKIALPRVGKHSACPRYKIANDIAEANAFRGDRKRPPRRMTRQSPARKPRRWRSPRKPRQD